METIILWVTTIATTVFGVALIVFYQRQYYYNQANMDWQSSIMLSINQMTGQINPSQQSIKDNCEHSWHTLINEEKDDQHIIIIECIKCGSISKDIIGRCNHEWQASEDIRAIPKYDIATAPIMAAATKLFQYAKGSAKFDKLVDTITEKWFSDDKDNNGDIFESRLVRTKICKLCGDMVVIDVSNSCSPSVQYVGRQTPMERTNAQDNIS